MLTAPTRRLKIRRALRSLAAMLLIGGVSCGTHAETLRIGGTGASLATFRVMAQEFRRMRPDVEIAILPSLGSTGGIRAVAQGAIGVGLSARPLSAEERGLPVIAMPYARTPFVFASSRGEPAPMLSTRQIADMYRGNPVTWPDGSPVRVILRPGNDASVDALRAVGPAMAEALAIAASRKGLKLAPSDQDNAVALENLAGSLGGITLAQLLSEQRKLTVIRLDGLEPSAKALSEGRYPHAMTLYLVTGASPSPLPREFIAFVRSPRGADILRKYGQLPVPG